MKSCFINGHASGDFTTGRSTGVGAIGSQCSGRGGVCGTPPDLLPGAN